jgi:IS5 family transposase
MENRHGLLVDFQVTTATGTAERDVVPCLIEDARVRGFHPKTLGADKGYDTRECVQSLRAQGVTPHVAQNSTNRHSAVDGRTTGGSGYIASQKVRKRIEEIFGWMKTVGGFRKTRYRGLERVDFAGYLVAAAYNLVRLVRLTSTTSAA